MKKDFNLLRLLVVLNEERQTILAAKRLHLSQPAISVMLKKLREQFNDPLFIRDKNQLEPTIRCQQLLETLPPILDKLDSLYIDNKDWDISALSDDITLLFSPPMMSTLAAPLVNTLTALAPNVTVECYHWGFDAIRDLELKTKCWGFSYLPMETNNTILQKDIGIDKFVVVMRKDHPIKAFQLENMFDYPICVNIIYGDVNSSRSEKIIKMLNLNKHINVRTSDISMMLSMISTTDYLGIISENNISHLKDNYRFEELPQQLTEEATQRAFSLFTHQRNRIDPMTQWLFQQAQAIMGQAIMEKSK